MRHGETRPGLRRSGPFERISPRDRRADLLADFFTYVDVSSFASEGRRLGRTASGEAFAPWRSSRSLRAARADPGCRQSSIASVPLCPHTHGGSAAWAGRARNQRPASPACPARQTARIPESCVARHEDATTTPEIQCHRRSLRPRGDSASLPASRPPTLQRAKSGPIPVAR
jgi:hypothetical protein